MTTEPRLESQKPPRWRFLLAIAFAAFWFCFLAVLTVTTANPVTVNRHQLLDSDAVVVGEFDQTSSRGSIVTLHVSEILAGRRLPSTLSVGGVELPRIASGGEFIVPLRASGDGYTITPAPAAFQGARLVYPATDDVRAAVEKILALQSPKPYR